MKYKAADTSIIFEEIVMVMIKTFIPRAYVCETDEKMTEPLELHLLVLSRQSLSFNPLTPTSD